MFGYRRERQSQEIIREDCLTSECPFDCTAKLGEDRRGVSRSVRIAVIVGSRFVRIFGWVGYDSLSSRRGKENGISSVCVSNVGFDKSYQAVTHLELK